MCPAQCERVRFDALGGVGSTWGQGVKSLNNGPLLSNINCRKPLWLLNISAPARILGNMRKLLAITLLSLLLSPVSPALANEKCFADYKAKQDNPLRLHYGVIRLNGACDKTSARSEVAARLSREGWVLLNVLSVFDKDGLKERKASAGRYFLRF